MRTTIYFYFAVCFLFFGVSHAQEMSKKFLYLVKAFQLNEAGFAYLNHCDDLEKRLIEKPFYMANAQIVNQLLIETMVAEGPIGSTTEQAEKRVKILRGSLENNLKKLYVTKDCENSQALSAKNYFDKMSDIHPEETLKSINEIK